VVTIHHDTPGDLRGAISRPELGEDAPAWRPTARAADLPDGTIVSVLGSDIFELTVSPKSSDSVQLRRAPPSLQSMQVDVTTRMGALTPATPTGIARLDSMLAGGLRSGTLVAITGESGVGKTSLALLLAYMAARAGAAVMFASVTVDETEVMARLAARALYRDYPESATPYGAIWSGHAWRDEYTRAAVSTSVETAVSKVGQLLHLYRARPLEFTSDLVDSAAHLWARHDRVVLVVDDVEAFYASAGGDLSRRAAANGSYRNRVAEVCYELRQVADSGCAVVVSAHQQASGLVAPPATLAMDMRPAIGLKASLNERHRALGARAIDLVVTKNQLGPTGVVPLEFVAGAAVFEERDR
jgi:KaiC/GvpD/RAD55 family RecA-like ATPase